MPVISADTLNLSHVLETTPGTTPTSPGFVTWRTTGESLVFAPQTTESTEIGGSGRSAKPSSVTGFEVNGSINFELASFPALQQAIAGVLAANWGECPLTGSAGGAIDKVERITVGKDLHTYTIEKRFPNPATVAGAVPTVTSDPAGAGTADITFTGTAAVGTGMVVIDVQVNAGTKQHVVVPIAVGNDATAVATAVAAKLTAFGDITATAAAGVVTVTPTTAGNIDVLNVRAGNDAYLYQRFIGATYSALSLSVSPNQTVTGSVTVVGGVPELDVLPLPGATYSSAGSNPVFTAPKVIAASFGKIGLSTHCWTDLSINIDSANRGVPCIGSKGSRETVLGTLSAEVSGSLYFQDQDLLQSLLDNTAVGNSVTTFSDSAGNIMRFDWYGMKPVSGQVAAGGAGQDLLIPAAFQPTPIKVCQDAAGTPWDSGLIISTEDTAPTLPTTVTPIVRTTRIVAGSPGTITGGTPADLPALKALGALGNTTAWVDRVVGALQQYVTLGDGSNASWGGAGTGTGTGWNAVTAAQMSLDITDLINGGASGWPGAAAPTNLAALKADGQAGDGKGYQVDGTFGTGTTGTKKGVAFTTGQFVMLGDGRQAHYDGAVWNVGPAA